jgi:hypothetical protein
VSDISAGDPATVKALLPPELAGEVGPVGNGSRDANAFALIMLIPAIACRLEIRVRMEKVPPEEN